MDFLKHIIDSTENIKDALSKLNVLGADAILFVVDERNNKLLGSLTDGDIRRGIINGLDFNKPMTDFIQPQPVYIKKDNYSLQDLISYKERNLRIIPIVDDDLKIVDILNFRIKSSLLPIEAVVMAGGRGQRLMPLTENCPKPMLKIGDKPILEYNIDRLIYFGIDTIHISINYLGHMIESYFGDGSKKHIKIDYIKEADPLGTIGSVKLIEKFDKTEILIMNSDLLTNIDYEDFYHSFKAADADIAVAATGYTVDIPYAVMEVDADNTIKSLREKPQYIYYSNAGIYLVKKEILDLVPRSSFDMPDLMNKAIEIGKKVITYPILGYWLDIGKMQDYNKAQEDIKHINFNK